MFARLFGAKARDAATNEMTLSTLDKLNEVCEPFCF